MGSCFSKRTRPPRRDVSIAIDRKHSLLVLNDSSEILSKRNVVLREEDRKKEPDDGSMVRRREVFVIKHRKSNDSVDRVANLSPNDKAPSYLNSSLADCAADAILVQSGLLSRNNSTGKRNSGGRRNYSGSKRSSDFDNDLGNPDPQEYINGCDGDAVEGYSRRERHRSTGSGSSPGRRMPSQEREQRSGSRERAAGSSSRRVSRSPGRRSDGNSTPAGVMPMKMVAVPATVAADKTNGGSVDAASSVMRISVKRNASPRSMSPARATATTNVIPSESNNLQRQQSGSRNASRKSENSPSPYRRHPLVDIDTNMATRIDPKKPATEAMEVSREQREQEMARNTRDLRSSYTKLLLEDIQNFHQNSAPQLTIPACLAKACTILEAVAGLNSTDSTLLEGKKARETDDEVQASDDLTEPSFDMFVTKESSDCSSSLQVQPCSAESSELLTSRSVVRSKVIASQMSSMSERGRVVNDVGGAVAGKEQDVTCFRQVTHRCEASK